jgi:hypothetical protein
MTYDYGSGALGDWSTLSHGTTGDFTTAAVAAFGDSILNRGRTKLASLLAAEPGAPGLATNYWSGRPTAPAVDALLGKAAELEAAGQLMPRVVLMATGANDIFQPMVMAEQIQRVKDAALENNGVQHLIWVDVQVCRTSVSTQMQVYDQRNSGLVNNQIHDAFDIDHIVDWNRWLSYRGTSYVPYYLEDGVHPWTAAGATPYNHGDGVAFWADVMMKKIRPLLTA